MFLWFSLVPQECVRKEPILGQDHFVPHPFQFLIQKLLYHSTINELLTYSSNKPRQKKFAFAEGLYLLTYSIVQSPSWEPTWFAASQEIPRISQNPKVHYRTHKPPPPVSILGQFNPVHIPTSHLLEFRPNIHPSTPRSPQWSPSLRFLHQDPIHPPLLTQCSLQNKKLNWYILWKFYMRMWNMKREIYEWQPFWSEYL